MWRQQARGARLVAHFGDQTVERTMAIASRIALIGYDLLAHEGFHPRRKRGGILLWSSGSQIAQTRWSMATTVLPTACRFAIAAMRSAACSRGTTRGAGGASRPPSIRPNRAPIRSEERRVGKECGRTWKST